MIRTMAVLLLAGCGAAFAQSMDTSPPRLVQPDKLANWWTMINSSVEADVPNYAKNVQAPGCATVSFVVEANGNTSTIKVQRVVPDGDFGKIARSIASGLHFEPTAFNSGRERVFSWLIFPFNLPADPAERTAVMQKCAVDGLTWKDR